MCMPVSTMSCCYEAICYWGLGQSLSQEEKNIMNDWLEHCLRCATFSSDNRIRKTSTTFKPVEERKWPKILSHIFNHSYTFSRDTSADDQDKNLHLSEVHTWWKPQCQENVDYSPTFLLWIRTQQFKIQIGGNNCSFWGTRFLQAHRKQTSSLSHLTHNAPGATCSINSKMSTYQWIHASVFFCIHKQSYFYIP